MSLSINISNSQPVYRPGDQISGTVTFNSGSTSVHAHQVYISLKHISKCRFGLQELETLYSANLTLHEQTLELLESPTNLQSSKEWPFSFTVAESTGFFATPFFEPTRLYNDLPDQPLPPSFNATKKETGAAPSRVKVTVGLYAEVVTEKVQSNVFKKGNINDKVLINFVPQRKTIQVDWDMTTKQSTFEARTPLLAETNGGRERSLSIKEKMLSSIKSSSLPSASFEILMSLPKTAIVGQPVPMFIGLIHDRARNQAQDNPTVSLKSLVVKMKAITALRGLSESKSMFRANYLPASHASSNETTELAKLSTPIELHDIVDLREHVVVRIPTDTIQSFSTFNIARTYDMHVQATIECAKQKFNASFDLSPITLAAAHDNDKITPPGIGPMIAGTDRDRLPTWEESGGYGMQGIPEEKDDLPLPPQYA